MNDEHASADSPWALSIDLLSAKALVWIASVGKDADLTREAHIYFVDRYSRLAECYRKRRRFKKADELEAKAEEHYRQGGGAAGPPYAAAIAMPRPSRFVRTNAVSRNRFPGPDDTA
jgi:hypothetical protein